jgi:signal transduction histidine kinase
MADKEQDRYAIIGRLAVAAVDDRDFAEAVREALELAARLVGLNAASVMLWDTDLTPRLQIANADSDSSRKKLQGLESDLFDRLRRDENVVSAYLSFGGDKPYHAFTLPLQRRLKLQGALIGLHEGDHRWAADSQFMEAFSAILSLWLAANGDSDTSGLSKKLIDKERLAAVIETAVTVNHEVNNPLTAILGNVQLLLSDKNELDTALKNKLGVIEASALKIRDVTQRLLRLTQARSVEYSEGASMLDISDEETPPAT